MGDHVTHTREQDLPLWEWAVREMPETTAPSAPVAYDAGRGAELLIPVPPKNPAPSLRTRALTTLSPMPPKKRPQPRRITEPDAKRPTRITWPTQAKLPDDIGKYVARDVREVQRLGWVEFMRRRQGRGDFASLADMKHPARRLLWQYKHRRAPVVLSSGSWTEGERQAALKRGPHRSATEHTLFLHTVGTL